MRRPVIAGNWKMHYTNEEAVEVAKKLIPLVKGAEPEVLICAPAVHLKDLADIFKGTEVMVGAQNMHWEEKGAFTGEISPLMLKALGVSHVIIGHSERRQYFAETDETVNLKLKSAFSHGLIPVMCCGETLEQRENGETEAHLEKQITLGLSGLSEENMKDIIIAYEPIWAIGTGKTATSEDAQETIKSIRNTVENIYGREIAQKVRILYGGSVKPSTIKEQMSMPDIDGALVGGASLKETDFSSIVNYK